MNSDDFIFDGKQLSDFGMMVCSFNGGVNENSIAGASINFNQISAQNGIIWVNSAVTYDSVLETTFQICKMPCGNEDWFFSFDEQREIGRWLNQKTFKEFTVVKYDSEYDDACCEGSFDQISRISINGKIVGYELHLITNRPYLTGHITRTKIVLDGTNPYTFYCASDDVGYIYPQNLKILCQGDGDLEITNSLMDRSTKFEGVTNGLVLSSDEFQNVEASDSSYDIATKYNYMSFRIGRSENSTANILSSTLPCTITFEYRPIYKGVGF